MAFNKAETKIYLDASLRGYMSNSSQRKTKKGKRIDSQTALKSLSNYFKGKGVFVPRAGL